LPNRTGKKILIKGGSCKTKWYNDEKPGANNSKWEREEDKKLLDLSLKSDGHNWEEIAEKIVYLFIKLGSKN
jgi:hypothetical protein